MAEAAVADTRLVTNRSHASLARNVAVLLGSQVATSTISLLPLVVLPIFLGDVGLGRLALAQSLSAILLAFTIFGSDLYVTRQVAARRELLPQLVWTNIVIRVPLGILLTAVMLLAVLGARVAQPATVAILLVLSLATLVSVVNGVMCAGLQGLEQMARRSVGSIANEVVVVAVGVPAVILTRSPITFAVAVLAGALVNLAVYVHYFRTVGLPFSRPTVAATRDLLAGATPFAAMAIVVSVYSQLDPLVIRAFADDANVGWFAAAMRLGPAVILIPTVITTAAVPILSRLHDRDRVAANDTSRVMLSLTLLITAPLATGLVLQGGAIFRLLHYPVAFDHSIAVLSLLAPTWLLTSIAMILGASVIAARRERAFATLTAVSLLVYLVSAVTLIPSALHIARNAAIGAAAANLISEAVVVAVLIGLVPRQTLGLPALGYAVRVAAATGVMALSGVLLGSAPPVVSIAGGAAAYTAASLALRTVTIPTLKMAFASVMRRDRGLVPSGNRDPL
jgi:O-antigen/teichoic acid export membrane protein